MKSQSEILNSCRKKWSSNGKCGSGKLSFITLPQCHALFDLGVSPTSLLFWVLFMMVEVVENTPLCFVSLRCQLYPQIGKELGMSVSAIDSLLRRASADYYSKGKYKKLSEYFPDGIGRPTSTQLISAWLYMVSDYAKAPPVWEKKFYSTETENEAPTTADPARK